MTKDQLKAILAKSDEQGQPGGTKIIFQAADGNRTVFSGAFVIERADVEYTPNAADSLDEAVKQEDGLVLKQA